MFGGIELLRPFAFISETFLLVRFTFKLRSSHSSKAPSGKENETGAMFEDFSRIPIS